MDGPLYCFIERQLLKFGTNPLNPKSPFFAILYIKMEIKKTDDYGSKKLSNLK